MTTEYKLVLYGDYGVGKTSLTQRLVRGIFDEKTGSTIGASFLYHKMQLDGKEIRMGIWDTAGQERFLSLLPMYLRGAHVILYCWDQTRAFDVRIAEHMYTMAKTAWEHPVDMYLVFTKTDLAPTQTCPAAEEWAKNKGIKAVGYTSSFTGQGVEELFKMVAQGLYNSPPPILVKKMDIVQLNSTPRTGQCCKT